MFLTLLIICVTAGAVLAVVKQVTDAPIQQVTDAQQQQAIRKVLPEFDSLKTEKKALETPPVQSVFHKEKAADSLLLYRAFRKGEPVGTAVETFTEKGFGGSIRMMAGFLTDGSIYKTCVLSHAETPGLGSKMTDADFYRQFEGRHPAQFRLQVKKDGGDVQAITAATISSRAYCDALNTAYSTVKSE